MDNGASSYRRFLDGDESGLIDIIKDYKDGLILYLNSFVNNINIAEDLTEDTFVKLGTRKPKDMRKSSFKTWLYTIGRNVSIDYLRHEHLEHYTSIENCQELISDEKNLEASFLKEERKIVIQKCLKKLKLEYRQILWLIYFEQFSNKEASVIMKKSVHNIGTLVYRARKSLKSQLDKEGFVYEDLR